MRRYTSTERYKIWYRLEHRMIEAGSNVSPFRLYGLRHMLATRATMFGESKSRVAATQVTLGKGATSIETTATATLEKPSDLESS